MIGKEKVYEEIARVLKRELMINTEFRADTPLEALGLDSIQLMQLLVYMEQAFNFEFAAQSTIESVRRLSLDGFADLVLESVAAAQPVT